MVRVMVGHTEHVFNEGKSIVRHAISERRNCDFCPQIPASDPELRERVEALRPSKDRFLSAYEEGRRDAIYEVLDVLGEPK